MRGLLKGVVRDHRVPHDYKFSYAQTTKSSTFLSGLKRSIATKLITKQYAMVPQIVFFGTVVPFFIF